MARPCNHRDLKKKKKEQCFECLTTLWGPTSSKGETLNSDGNNQGLAHA